VNVVFRLVPIAFTAAIIAIRPGIHQVNSSEKIGAIPATAYIESR
jgi:hypothetical protein